jgi:hypothetical protein
MSWKWKVEREERIENSQENSLLSVTIPLDCGEKCNGKIPVYKLTS